MSICDLTSGVSRIQRATKELRDAWVEAKTHWNDQNAIAFEKEFLEPILPHVRLILAETHELHATFNKAEHACRDDQKSTD